MIQSTQSESIADMILLDDNLALLASHRPPDF